LLERRLKHFGQAPAVGSALAFTEWALLDVGEPHVRPPQCDTRVSPADRRWLMAQRAAEVAQRHALFDAAIATPTP